MRQRWGAAAFFLTIMGCATAASVDSLTPSQDSGDHSLVPNIADTTDAADAADGNTAFDAAAPRARDGANTDAASPDAAEAAADSDCSDGGFCSPSEFIGCSVQIVEYDCHDDNPADECSGDPDCPGVCHYGGSKWTCEQSSCEP